jgi:hypothetical protein
MATSRQLQTGALIAAAVSLLAAGCQVRHSFAPPAGSQPARSSGASTPRTTARLGDVAGGGILLARCPGDGSVELMLIDPTAGVKRADRRVRLAQNITCPNEGGAVQHFRETFSPDLTKFAAVRTNPADGSTTVGYYDLGSGAWTAAPADPKAPSGFGAKSQETDPVFSPTTGSLWFRSGTAVMSVKVGSSTVSDRQELPWSTRTSGTAESGGPGTGGPAFLIAPGSGKLVLDAARLPNPSGTAAVTMDAWLFSPPDTVRFYRPTDMGTPGSGQSLHINADCSPDTWISDTKFVCWAGTAGPQVADVSNPTGTLSPLLPPNDLSNSWFTGNPRNHNVAFLSQQAQTLRLDITDASRPGVQPRTVIGHLPGYGGSYLILSWTG